MTGQRKAQARPQRRRPHQTAPPPRRWPTPRLGGESTRAKKVSSAGTPRARARSCPQSWPRYRRRRLQLAAPSPWACMLVLCATPGATARCPFRSPASPAPAESQKANGTREISRRRGGQRGGGATVATAVGKAGGDQRRRCVAGTISALSCVFVGHGTCTWGVGGWVQAQGLYNTPTSNTAEEGTHVPSKFLPGKLDKRGTCNPQPSPQTSPTLTSGYLPKLPRGPYRGRRGRRVWTGTRSGRSRRSAPRPPEKQAEKKKSKPT